MLIICAVMVPLTVLTDVFCIYTIHSLTNADRDNAAHTLETFCRDMDRDIDIVAANNERTQREYWNEIVRIDKGIADATEIHTLWEQLKSTRQMAGIVDICYITPGIGGIANLTVDFDLHDLEEIDLLQKRFATLNHSDYAVSSLQSVKIGEQIYLIWEARFTNFAYGYLVSPKSLRAKLSTYLKEGESATICDNTGKVLLTMGTPVREAKAQHHFQNGRFEIALYSPPSARTTVLSALLVQTAVITILLLVLAWRFLYVDIMRPLQTLQGGMSEIQAGNLDLKLQEVATTDDFTYMQQSFNAMVSQIQTLKIASYEQEIERLQVEATNLRLQVSPHLLLNSLNMIYSLAQTDKVDLLKDFTVKLMKYFRYALRNTDSLVPLSAEMQFVDDYLAVQAIRFPDNLDPHCRYDEQLADCPVPSLLIENFVENAVNHGRVRGLSY